MSWGHKPPNSYRCSSPSRMRMLLVLSDGRVGSAHRTSRGKGDDIHVLINQRPVAAGPFLQAIRRGYKARLMQGRHPSLSSTSNARQMKWMSTSIQPSVKFVCATLGVCLNGLNGQSPSRSKRSLPNRMQPEEFLACRAFRHHKHPNRWKRT